MSASAGPPQKTALGVDELRRRTRGLSQRHRTMLLLVNGQRSRREVLALATQAGVGVEFFDELVAMGLVEARVKTAASAAPAPAAAEAGAPTVAAVVSTGPNTLAPPSWGDAASTLRMRLEPVLAPPQAGGAATTAAVPPGAAAAQRVEPGFDDRVERAIAQALAKPGAGSAAVPGPRSAAAPRSAREPRGKAPQGAAPAVPTLDDAVPESETRPMSEDLAPDASAPAPAATRSTSPAAFADTGASWAPGAAKVALPRAEPEPGGAARVKFSGAAQKPPKPASRRHAAAARRDEPKLTPAEPPAQPARLKMPAAAGPLEGDAEAHLLAEVRSLLIGTLLVDGPLTSSLTALRVRKAYTRFDLTALVWEIERTLLRAKRPREAQARLAKARDLLGLGNTVVDEETSPGFSPTLPPPTR